MKPHKFDALSFIVGAIVTGIGLMFLLLPQPGDIIDAFTSFSSWFWPLVFVAIGVAILAPLLSRSRDEEESDEPTEV